jgi:cytochrome P450
MTTSEFDQFPFPSSSPWILSPEYARRRSFDPLGPVRLADGGLARLAVRYGDVKAVLADPRFSRDVTNRGASRQRGGADMNSFGDLIVNMDPPRHSRIRGLVNSAFSARRVRQWRPVLVRTAHDLITQMRASGSSADLISAFIFPFPLIVICELLGIPATDRGVIREMVEGFLSAADSATERIAAARRFAEYAGRLIAAHRVEPGDRFLDHLVAARDEQGRLTDQELVYLIIGLIIGGNEGVAGALSRALPLMLDTKPETEGSIFESLRADPALVPGAVDEAMRLEFPGEAGLVRVAKTDVDLPSGLIRADEAVLPVICAANRDPSVFPEPDRFDPRRRSAQPHLGLGHGVHHCLGAHLGRLEMEIALEVMTATLPALRLAVPRDSLPWLPDNLAKRLTAMPVSW